MNRDVKSGHDGHDVGNVNKDPRAADERIGELIRLAGPRPAAPPDRTARVRAAIREHWRAEVTRRSRRRRRVTAGLAAAASLIVLIAFLPRLRSQAPPTVARVELAAGAAWMRSGSGDDRPLALQAGAVLAASAEVATEGDGRLALRTGSGHSVRVAAGSRLRLLSEDRLALTAGRIYVDSGPVRTVEVEPLEIDTPFGTVRDIGTQFELLLDAAAVRVRVREGRVLLDGSAGPREVAAGRELEIDRQGRAREGGVPISGAAWAWLGKVTPMIDIEGRSAREFLDWAAREQGLRLDYDSSTLAVDASGILLNGSIEGMSVEQALEAVLPACGLRHRVEAGRLVVADGGREVEEE